MLLTWLITAIYAEHDLMKFSFNKAYQIMG